MRGAQFYELFALLTSKIGMKIKKDDIVKILSGKSKGKTGKVTRVFPDEGKIVVEGVNVCKKHRRPTRQGESGQIIQMPLPIDASNASVMCSSCSKPARLGGAKTGKTKSRVCKKCGASI